MSTSTSSAQLRVVDTNLVVYAHDAQDPHHRDAKRLLDSASSPDAGLCVTSQILAEFFAIVTSTKRVAQPRSPEEAASAVERLLQMPGLALLPTPADIVVRWLDLVRQCPVTQQRIFDLQLVATMLGNGVNRIYTFNRSDFEGLPGITVLSV